MERSSGQVSAKTSISENAVMKFIILKQESLLKYNSLGIYFIHLKQMVFNIKFYNCHQFEHLNPLENKAHDHCHSSFFFIKP